MLVFMAAWWIWIVLAEVVFLFAALAYDKGTMASVSLLVFGVALYWLGDVNFITYLKDNPLDLVYGLLIYFPIGTAWAIFKWFMLVLDRKTEYKEFKTKFFELYELKTLELNTSMTQASVDNQLFDEATLTNWNKALDRKNQYQYPRSTFGIPQVYEYKYDILRWLGYWPINLIWTLVNDFVRRVSKAIYNMIQSKLQSISDKVFSDVKADFK